MSAHTKFRFWIRGLIAVNALVLLHEAPLTSENAEAAEAPISLGEVSIADGRSHVDTEDFRALATAAMGRTVWPSEVKRPTIVSVAVVSVERTTSGPRDASVTCLVSATLRDRKTGNLYAVVESRAKSEEKTSADERATVSFALDNVIGQLPGVVR